MGPLLRVGLEVLGQAGAGGASQVHLGIWAAVSPTAESPVAPLALTAGNGLYAPGFYPPCGTYHEKQGFAGSTYRPSYRHPGVATCSLGNPGPILGSAATGTARSAVGGSFQTFLAEHRARATGVSL